MFARREWFSRRKYGGWGVTPKDWRGIAYFIIMIGSLFIIQAILPLTEIQRVYVSMVWLFILLIDIVPIMITVEKDEMEKRAEAISDRNAAWAMVFILLIGLLYEMVLGIQEETVRINWFILGALIMGALAKTITEIVIGRKGIK